MKNSASDVFESYSAGKETKPQINQDARYKARKKATQSSIINREFRKGRGYDDFQKLLKDDPPLPVVEMDLVEGRK